MICPVCFGRKYDFKKDGNSGYFVECKKCHGTGKIETTNEEWFCALSTEEKAKFLAAQQLHGGTIASRSDVDWEVWLKEKHE